MSKPANRTFVVGVLSALLLITTVVVYALSPLAPVATPQKNQAVTLEILQKLKRKHFSDIPVDDALSSRFLDNYLEKLDPNKAFFYKADIDEFEKYRFNLDDNLKDGNNNAGFVIYDRFRQRLIERLHTVIALLKDDDVIFNFNKDESISADSANKYWLLTEAEGDDYWRKRIKSFLLAEKLAGEEPQKARDQLIKRYTNRLSRIEKSNDDEIYEIFINAFTELYDPHTNYLAPRTAENFNINMSLSLEGIGAVLQSEDEYTKVVRLVTGGPAQKQGELQAADFIVGVAQGDDGEMIDVTGWRLDEVVALIRGPKDSIVRLQVDPANPAEKGTKVVRIKRDKVKLEDQAAQKAVLELTDANGKPFKVGVINIPAFYIDFQAARNGDPDFRSTTRDVLRLLDELREENISGVILDLRNNGGGSLQEATTLTDLFINRGPVVQIGKGRMNSSTRARDDAYYQGPLVVLINRLSASASEIFAGAIQDYQRGLIVGSQSFGKGTVQSLAPLDSRGDLKITESKFYRVSGESTQHRGVIPDILFPELLNIEKIGESSYETALSWSQIAPLQYPHYLPIQEVLAPIASRHQQRIVNDPDFTYLLEQKSLLEQFTDKPIISLNETVRLQEKQNFENANLNLENKRRLAKGLKPYKDYTEYKKGTEEDSRQKATRAGTTVIDTENDAMLREAGFILRDFSELMQEAQSSKVAASPIQ